MAAIQTSSNFTRSCLRIFIVSVAASALTGAAAIAMPLDDSWGWFQVRVFLTTVIIAATSVCGLACGGCLARGDRVMPVAGIALALISGGLAMAGLWIEIHSDIYWKLCAVTTSFAVACAHLSMLLMARLHGGYRWAHVFCYQLILGLAGLVAIGIVVELFDHEAYWRLVGVLSVAVAALTLVTPVFHFLSRDLAIEAHESGDPLLRVEEQIAYHKKQLLALQAERSKLLGRTVDLKDSSIAPS